MTIEPNGYKKLIEENEKLKKENKELNEFINHVKELSNYHERKKLEYKEENEKLISNVNLHLAKNFELQKEHKNLKHRLHHLSHTNTKLQNDLFSEQLEQDETENYINRLKQELFNLYLKHYN